MYHYLDDGRRATFLESIPLPGISLDWNIQQNKEMSPKSPPYDDLRPDIQELCILFMMIMQELFFDVPMPHSLH